MLKQIFVELNDKSELYNQIEGISRAWQSGRYKRLLIHIYSGMDREEFTAYVAKILRILFPGADIVGTMSAGEIVDGHLMKRGILVGALFFESTDVAIFRYDNVKGNEAVVGRQIRERIDSIPDIRAVELLLPGTEFETKSLFDEIDECDKSVKIFGGYSGGHQMNSPIHYIFDATGIKYDSILVTTFAGRDFHLDMDKVIGWEPLGVPFKVTKADGHRLEELNGRPASEIYERFLQIDRRLSDNAQEGYTFPLLARYKGEQWLRSAIHIEEDGSLNMHGYVMEGMDIQLSYGNPVTIVNQINKRLDRLREFKPQAVFIYSCIVRKAFWERYVDLEITPYEKIGPTSGFYTWGEIIRDMNSGEIVEHNVTQLSIGMREGEPSLEEIPEIHVDDAVLKGPAAQLRRLTSLVYTTMEELEKTQDDLRVLNEKLRAMAEKDALTKIYNRGKTEEIIYELLEKSAKEDMPLSLLMIDIDHFKGVNDIYGHQTGDLVLKELASILNKTAGDYPDGKAGRWGGEEFFVMLPDIENEEALSIGEDLRKTVEAYKFPEVGHLTISIGIISVKGDIGDKNIFLCVDKALYEAKEGGRNRVVNAVLE